MDDTDGLSAPNPFEGWATGIEELRDALVVPPLERSFRQPAGVLRADGSYCAGAALWRKHREITTEPPAPDTPAEPLPGRWLWGGVLWHHFGHFVVESTGRLWGLGAIERPVDGVLFIPKSPKNGDGLTRFHSDFFALAGTRARVLTGPARVAELVVPGQGFGIGRIVLGTEACRRFYRESFAADIAPEGPERLYVSRSAIGPTRGALVCETRLERHLAAEGYEIFHPQKHDIATQIARYRAARQVIASEGSAIHLFGLVARRGQSLAVVIRRRSTATKYIERHVHSFSGIEPLMIDAVQRLWRPEGRAKPRFARGQPDMPAIQARLREHGFVGPGPAWPALSDEDVSADLNRPGRPGPVYRAVG